MKCHGCSEVAFIVKLQHTFKIQNYLFTKKEIIVNILGEYDPPSLTGLIRRNFVQHFMMGSHIVINTDSWCLGLELGNIISHPSFHLPNTT